MTAPGTKRSGTNRESIPSVPKDADSGLVWKSEGPHRPTKVWVHECGSRAARWEQGATDSKTVFYCPACDVKRTIATSYGFEEIAVRAERQAGVEI